MATIETDLGSLECKMFADKAPITVANFVGLARGLRPWKNGDGKWVKTPAYEGTVFHRIIKGFMIQGGDTAKKAGRGEAGYVIPDEIWEDANHDRAGLLCMANRGPEHQQRAVFHHRRVGPAPRSELHDLRRVWPRGAGAQARQRRGEGREPGEPAGHQEDHRHAEVNPPFRRASDEDRPGGRPRATI
jgi:cyclophilin family peptidyl-prolyl cis-trans isomerase